MRIIGSSAMSRDVLWRVSGPALGWRNRLSLRSGPATSLLAQNRAKSGDSWASRAGRAVQAGSSRWTVIAARYMATCLARRHDDRLRQAGRGTGPDPGRRRADRPFVRLRVGAGQAARAALHGLRL